MTAWGTGGDDPTQPQPRPAVTEYHTHNHAGTRSDSIMVALIVLLTFVLGALALCAAVYSLSSTVDRLLSVPMCQEARR